MKDTFGPNEHSASCRTPGWVIVGMILPALLLLLIAPRIVRAQTAEIVREPALLWSVPRFGVLSAAQSPDGLIAVLSGDRETSAVSIIVGLEKTGPGHAIALPGLPSDSDYRIAAGSGGSWWIVGKIHQHRSMLNMPLSDGFLAKLSRAGTVEWQRQFGDDGQRDIFSVAALPGGDVVLVGKNGPVNWLARISSDGQTVWENAFGTGEIASVALVGDSIVVAAFEAGSRTDQVYGSSHVAVWSFDQAGSQFGHTVLGEDSIGRPHPAWQLTVLPAIEPDQFYAFSAWSDAAERPTKYVRPISVVRADIRGKILWRKDVPESVSVLPFRADLCWSLFAVGAGGDALTACAEKGGTRLIDMNARTSASKTSFVPDLDRRICTSRAGVAHAMFQRQDGALWILGTSPGCTWMIEVKE